MKLLIPTLFFYILVNQWVSGGHRFCEYSNGEVLRVGAANLCPMRIDR